MRAEVTNSTLVFAALMPHAPVLVPAVGRERIDEVAGTVKAMREVAARLIDSKPRTLVLLSPHSPRQRGAFGIWNVMRLRGTLAMFGASEARVDLPTDHSLANAIVREAAAQGIAMWEINEPSLDHGSVVPLWFAIEAGWQGPTVILGLNASAPSRVVELGQAVAAAAAACNARVAIVASGDMSHRLTRSAPCGYEPRAAEFDRWLIETIRGGDYRALRQADPELEYLAAEDALDSVLFAAGATGFDATGHEVLCYEGPFGVGYGVAVLFNAAARPKPAQKEGAVWSRH